MLTGGTDQQYRNTIGTGGRFVRVLDVYKSGELVSTLLDETALGPEQSVPSLYAPSQPLIDGSLTVNLENRVTRKLRLQLQRSLFPAVPGDLLDPYETELVLSCGWRGGAHAPYLWPVFTGPVTTVSRVSSSSSFSLDATDRVEQITEDRFTTPVSSGIGTLVSTRVKDLISDSQPGATFGVFDETYVTVPELTWDADRAQALDDLAAAAGCFWYQLPDGSYTMRLIPWAQQTLGDPVVVLTEGTDQMTVTLTRSRTGVYTICQVTGEAPNGDDPVSGTAENTDENSPTYVRGPLGRRVQQVQLDTVSSSAQAESLARQRLLRSRTMTMEVATRSWYDPSLELGDVARIVTDDGTFDRALASFTASIGRSPTMSARWRAPGEDDNG